MAKLNAKLQKQTEAAESGSFDPLPDGVYHLRLVSVDTTRSGPKGPYWSWEFDVLDEGFRSRKLWNNTSLAENAAFKMKETFEAFGAPLDTDTDDLCGMVCKGVVSQRVIQQGTRQGEIGNNINRLSLKDDDFEVPESEGGAGQPAAENIF